MLAIEAHNVSIRYFTGDFKDIGIKEYILRKITGKYQVNEFWAIKDVSFTLEKGDMLGIIGTNGAGKSTLLKAVSDIMMPTKGWVHTNGTISALLELTTGFDNDLTVRENTYLRGALLGYTRKFMDETYDQIIQFAELEDFQDSAFKNLSSGMKSRLAFSIACLVNPDIIISCSISMHTQKFPLPNVEVSWYEETVHMHHNSVSHHLQKQFACHDPATEFCCTSAALAPSNAKPVCL